MIQTTASKPRQSKQKKYMLVRYGHLALLGFFEHNEPQILRPCTAVIVKTERGLELGHIVGGLCCYRAGQFRFSQERLETYYSDSGAECNCSPAGSFFRYATAEDLSEQRHLEKIGRQEMANCRRLVSELGLSMRIIDVEHIFGGERVIFYFMADGRVDFRQLVKSLAQEYQTRIEMRQIGSRDEAKILGDVESCGQQCCCGRFLRALKPVSMRMAKMQKATLDPSKISGYCGKLKCCLRYEDQTYTSLKERLPPKGAIVKTAHGRGRVVDGQILAQLVMVEHDDGEKIAFNVNDVEIISPSPNRSDSDGTGRVEASDVDVPD